MSRGTDRPAEPGTGDASAEPPPLARLLQLAPHPEGGWFRQTWRAPVTVQPPGYAGSRPSATAIYYLLAPGETSMWHQVASDELWLHARGVPLLLQIGGRSDEPGADVRDVVLGPAVELGQQPQALVPAGHWQRAQPLGQGDVLVSCVVSPGFDFVDFRTL